MKKLAMALAGATVLVGSASAANLVITAHQGQSLATYAHSDDDNDDNDGLSFLDHYTDGSQDYLPFNNVSLSQESAIGGGELQLKYENKSLTQTYMSGWINFAQPFGIPGTFTLKYGRFDAFPAVDFVGDANRGFHYASYAVNPLYDKTPGFSAQTMSWFLAQQGLVRGARDTGHYSYTNGGTSASRWAASVDYSKAIGGGALSSYPWLFNDLSNAGGRIVYDSGYYAVSTSMMAQYAPNENMVFRFVAKAGSASDKAASYVHDFYGQKTFTNWNAQVSIKAGDIANIGLTVKMSDMLSGTYTTGAGQWKSAGTDLTAALAASSDTLVDGLRLFVGYGFASAYMGMKADTAEKADLNEMYMFHAIDLRAVYDIDEQFSVGLNGNLSMVNQSEFYKQKYKEENNGDNPNDFLGFNAGVSASYALSDTLAIDFNAGFRCLNVNHKVTKTKADGTTEVEVKDDMLAVSSFGVEPSIVFTFSKNAALSIGINVLVQNLSGNDVAVGTWQANNMANHGDYHPFTTIVTVPLYMFIRI